MNFCNLCVGALFLFPLVLCDEYHDMIINLDGKLSTYDKRIRPDLGRSPVKIHVSMWIIKAFGFDDTSNVSAVKKCSKRVR
jgi:hypothetical protein